MQREDRPRRQIFLATQRSLVVMFVVPQVGPVGPSSFGKRQPVGSQRLAASQLSALHSISPVRRVRARSLQFQAHAEGLRQAVEVPTCSNVTWDEDFTVLDDSVHPILREGRRVSSLIRKLNKGKDILEKVRS